MKKIIFLFFILPSISCLSQVTITGTIINGLNNQPLSNVNVFLSNSSIGSQTNDEGRYCLTNVKPGKYDIIVSMVGFEALKESVTINNESLSLPNIPLFPKTTALREVTIKPQNVEDRVDYLAWFKEEFLGKSSLASGCEILNPEILDLAYDKETNTLTVSAPDFLEIDNRSLGYHVKYLLHNFVLAHKGDSVENVHFEGWALFKEMKGPAAEQRRWQKQRLLDYEGSPMHFLRSLTVPQYAHFLPAFFEEGFWVMRLLTFPNPKRPGDSLIYSKINYFKKPEVTGHRDSLSKWKNLERLPKTLKKLYNNSLSTGEFVKPTDKKGIFALGLTRPSYSLFINYEKNRLKKAKNGQMVLNVQSTDNLAAPQNVENSVVSFNEAFALFDKNGQVLNVNGLTFAGVWARRRIAELLPVDYVPVIKKIK